MHAGELLPKADDGGGAFPADGEDAFRGGAGAQEMPAVELVVVFHGGSADSR